MSQQNNHDISNVQVPDSFIQEILNETQPLKEGREEVYSAPKEVPQRISEGHTSSDESIVKLLTLMFEEFDKLNSRLDSIQEGINETTAAGALGTVQKFALGNGGNSSRKNTTPEEEQRKLEGKSRRTSDRSALADLLAKRIGR